MNKKLVLIGAILAGLTAFAWYNDSPQPTRAVVDPMDEYVMFGIDSDAGNLVRFDFATDTLTTLGQVVTSDATVLTGIEASAYVPGHLNIFAFWPDPSDQLTKLVYVNARSGAATVVGNPIGAGAVPSAVATIPSGGSDYKVYAVQAADGISFSIDGGSVVPDESFAVRVTSLGAAISAGYSQPVTVRVLVGAESFEPYGDSTQALAANVNDTGNPRHFVAPNEYDALTGVSIVGTSWLKTSGTTGDSESDWYVQRTANSSEDSPQIIALRDGDAVPDIPGYNGQASAVAFVQDYIDPVTDRIRLGANQTIYLFELGTADLTSSAADFQDLVVLVTLAKETTDLIGNAETEHGVAGVINIDPNSSENSEFSVTKADSGTITLGDLHEGAVVDGQGTFYDGAATEVRVRPAGSGGQTGLLVDGATYPIENGNVYEVAAQAMTVTVYNDQLDGAGMPVGQWWVQIDTASAAIIDSGTNLRDQLVTVDPKTGTTEHVMYLERAYEGLAGVSGGNLYGVYGQQLYLINLGSQTESLVGLVQYAQTECLEFAGSALMGYGAADQRLARIDTITGLTNGSAIDLGLDSLGSVVFMRASDESAMDYVGMD